MVGGGYERHQQGSSVRVSPPLILDTWRRGQGRVHMALSDLSGHRPAHSACTSTQVGHIGRLSVSPIQIVWDFPPYLVANLLFDDRFLPRGDIRELSYEYIRFLRGENPRGDIVFASSFSYEYIPKFVYFDTFFEAPLCPLSL